MKGNFHVRFLEGGGLETACSHSTNKGFFQAGVEGAATEGLNGLTGVNGLQGYIVTWVTSLSTKQRRNATMQPMLTL